tara:strand:- start:834 stop:1112 length:279 start_codon:yes stop_codon:yes gene_type:complete
MNEKQKKEYFEFLINSYDEGTASIKGDHPEEVKIAIDSFFKAGKILVDHPEIGTIPTEYVDKLLGSLAQYPQYHQLVLDLVEIIQKGEEFEA